MGENDMKKIPRGRPKKNKDLGDEQEEQVKSEMKEPVEFIDIPGRKEKIKKVFVDLIKTRVPEINRKFSMHDYLAPGGTKGLIREKMNGDFYVDDRYLVREIISELRIEGFLYHVGGNLYSRLK